MISPVVVYLGAVIFLVISCMALYQLGSIATAAREIQDSSAKAALLLTVIANHQGATAADVERAMGVKEKAAK